MDSKTNMEFNIIWCETNIRYLHDELPSEDRDRKIAFNVAEIECLKAALAAYKGVKA